VPLGDFGNAGERRIEDQRRDVMLDRERHRDASRPARRMFSAPEQASATFFTASDIAVFPSAPR